VTSRTWLLLGVLWSTIVPSRAEDVATAARPADPYRADIEAWRQAREQRLRGADGWLTLAGLHWLKPGQQRLGSAPGTEVTLPASAPAHAAEVTLDGGQVRFQLAPGVSATLDDAPAPVSGILRPDSQGEPSRLAFGPVSLYVIERGGRHGLRIKDRDHTARREFKGLEWFPIDPAYRVNARLRPHPGPRRVRVPNVLGQVEEMRSPGVAEFTLAGRRLKLVPVLEDGSDELFFILRDATSGRSTYGGGRFLYAAPPAAGSDGTFVLDFNKAYSPPCAFTPYATCPLPPPENRLGLALEAGEKHAAGAHAD
jgi:hypothetical protein